MHHTWITGSTIATLAILFAGGTWADDQNRSTDRRANEQSTRSRSQERDEPSASRRSEGRRQQTSSDELTAQGFIEDFDRNGDGVLQRDEMPRRMRNQIEFLDQNQDGKLTRQELRSHGRRAAADSDSQQAQKSRKVMPLEIVYVWISDADRSQISLSQLQRAYDTLQQIDDNGDGQLSRDELQQRRQEMHSRWAKMVTERLDQNDDQRISHEEAQNTGLAVTFSTFDQNDDGVLSQKELQQCLADGSVSQASLRTAERDGRQASDNERSAK